MSVRLSDRARIASQFEMWCEEHSVRLCAQAMMAFLDSIGVFNEEAVRGYLKALRKEDRSYTGIKKFKPSEDKSNERESKKR